MEILGRSGPVIPPMPSIQRSSKWPGVLKAFLVAHPKCLGCGRKAETAHHIVPYKSDKNMELDTNNLAPVCVPCHFVLCHGGDWDTYNPDCVQTMLAHRQLKFLPI